MGLSFLKKLYVLVAVLLCSVLLSAVPVASLAGPSSPVTQISGLAGSDDSPCTLTAGEVSSGEAVLQLDKTLLIQLMQHVLQQNYPEHLAFPAVPAFYSFSKRDNGLHTILTKGP